MTQYGSGPTQRINSNAGLAAFLAEVTA